MSRPDQLPEWASGTGADRTEPPSGQKETGWVSGQVPPAGWWNWWANLVYTWVVYMAAYIEPTGLVGFKYDDGDGAQVRREVGPCLGGWSKLTGSDDIDIFGGPPRYVQCTGTGDVEVSRGLDFLTTNDQITDPICTITGLTMVYARTAGVVQIRLMRAKRDGTGSSSAVVTLTGDSTTGAFVTKTNAAIAHDVDPTYSYWLDAVLDPDAAADDVKLSFVQIAYKKARVE